MISVPPVVNPVLNINPYPIPDNTAPNTTITINSVSPRFIYGTNFAVNSTNIGNIIDPITEFFVILVPNVIKLIINRIILDININSDGFIPNSFNTIERPLTPKHTILYCKKNTLNAKAVIRHPIINNIYLFINPFLFTFSIISSIFFLLKNLNILF